MLLAMAQSRQLSGTVVDQAGSPVVGATVMVEGSTVGTTTGAGGRFTLAVPADGTLQVSFIGYQTQSVPVNGRTSVEIRLSEDTKAIDEVLVVAYGTAKKESFTGSAAVIKSENLEKRVVSNVSKALDGQVAGVADHVGQRPARIGGYRGHSRFRFDQRQLFAALRRGRYRLFGFDQRHQPR